MTILRFDIEKIAGLADHARNAPGNAMGSAQRAEVYGEDNAFCPQPGEEAVARAELCLVKDRGIYIGSSGIYPEGHERTLPGGRMAVAYAVGYDPADHDPGELHNLCRAAVGGDDFVESIPLEWLDAAVDARAPEFVVDFAPDGITLVLPTKPPPPPRT